jgi:hypothetical protein
MAALGDAMLIDSGPTGMHLHVVIWGPGPLAWLADGDQILLASVTTIYPGVPFDDACVLAPGEHEFIEHESWVYYRCVRVDTPEHVKHMVDQGLWPRRAACSAEILHRMRVGLCKSKRIDRRFKIAMQCAPEMIVRS